MKKKNEKNSFDKLKMMKIYTKHVIDKKLLMKKKLKSKIKKHVVASEF